MRIPTVTGEVASTPPTGEIRSLTGLRIVAAAWVVCYHFSSAPGDSWSRYWEPVLPLVRSGTLGVDLFLDRKSTRLNSSHANISYAVFCLKKQQATRRRRYCISARHSRQSALR